MKVATSSEGMEDSASAEDRSKNPHSTLKVHIMATGSVFTIGTTYILKITFFSL